MLIRISTKRKRVKWLHGLIGELFPGFISYRATGCWRGKKEKSIVFEIDTAGFDRAQLLLLGLNIKMVVTKICGLNRQESVLIQKLESTSYFLAGNCK